MKNGGFRGLAATAFSDFAKNLFYFLLHPVGLALTIAAAVATPGMPKIPPSPRWEMLAGWWLIGAIYGIPLLAVASVIGTLLGRIQFARRLCLASLGLGAGALFLMLVYLGS